MTSIDGGSTSSGSSSTGEFQSSFVNLNKDTNQSLLSGGLYTEKLVNGSRKYDGLLSRGGSITAFKDLDSVPSASTSIASSKKAEIQAKSVDIDGVQIKARSIGQIAYTLTTPQNLPAALSALGVDSSGNMSYVSLTSGQTFDQSLNRADDVQFNDIKAREIELKGNDSYVGFNSYYNGTTWAKQDNTQTSSTINKVSDGLELRYSNDNLPTIKAKINNSGLDIPGGTLSSENVDSKEIRIRSKQNGTSLATLTYNGTTNITYKLPTSLPSISGQVLSSDTTGSMSWQSGGGSSYNQSLNTTDSPTFTGLNISNASFGSITSPNVLVVQAANGPNLELIGSTQTTVLDSDIIKIRNTDGTSEKVTVLANGNVGIGTTTPGNKLQINGSCKTNSLLLGTSSGNTTLSYNGTNNISYNLPSVQGSALQVLSNDGLGNLTWSTVSGMANQTLNTTDNVTFNNLSINGQQTVNNNAVVITTNSNITGVSAYPTGNALHMRNNNNTTGQHCNMILATAGANAGDAYLGYDIYFRGCFVQGYDNASNKYRLVWGIDFPTAKTTDSILSADQFKKVIVGNDWGRSISNQARLTVLDINTSSTLDVASITSGVTYSTRINTSSTGSSISFQGPSTFRILDNNSGTPPFVEFQGGKLGINVANPTYQLQLSSDSAGKPTTATWTVSSDQRIKKNIEDANLDILYDNLKNIKLKRYEWDEKYYDSSVTKDRHQLGWIAQQVKTVYPKSVQIEQKVFKPSGHKWIEKETKREIPSVRGEPSSFEVIKEMVLEKSEDEIIIEDFHSLNSDELYKCMFGALQKVIMKVEVLESEVSLLKNENNSLKSRLNMEKSVNDQQVVLINDIMSRLVALENK